MRVCGHVCPFSSPLGVVTDYAGGRHSLSCALSFPLSSHLQLRKIEARGVELESEVDENQQRLGIVKEHYKYLRAEVQNTQSIVEAKTRELESERHLKTLADRCVVPRVS
mgnify:CR=1 FL=1